MNPAKILTDTYERAGASELFAGNRYSVPAFRNEERIFVASKTSGKSISHNLFGCYRRKVGSKEYFFAFDHCTTHEYFGTKIDHTRLIGKVDDVPIITSSYSINPNSIRSDTAMVIPEKGPAQVESTHTVYLWPWEEIRSQLLKWKNADIINDNTNFYFQNGNDKYGRYTWEEWFDLDWSDLELLGKFGNRVRGVWKPGEPLTQKLDVLREQLKEELKNPAPKAR